MKVQSTKGIGVGSLKFLIYGESGIGKTTLAGTTGEPTFILSLESGLLSLNEKEVDFVNISVDDDENVLSTDGKLAKIREVYEYLRTPEAKEKYRWVIVDSLTEIGQLYVDMLKNKYPEKKDSFSLWGEYTDSMRNLVKSFRDLSGYNVVMTALSEVDKDDVGRRFQNIMLQGKIANHLPGYFDEVFYYTKINFEDGTSERALITEVSEKAVAKDRSGRLEPIEQPNLAQIASKIRRSV